MVAANQEEIAKLKRTLNLNPGQVEAIEAFFASEAEEQNKIMQEMFARKPLEELQAEMMGRCRIKSISSSRICSKIS